MDFNKILLKQGHILTVVAYDDGKATWSYFSASLTEPYLIHWCARLSDNNLLIARPFLEVITVQGNEIRLFLGQCISPTLTIYVAHLAICNVFSEIIEYWKFVYQYWWLLVSFLIKTRIKTSASKKFSFLIDTSLIFIADIISTWLDSSLYRLYQTWF